MSNKQAGKLIIENIQMLEEAIALLNGDLSQQIFGEIEKIVKEKVSTYAGEWQGEYALFDDWALSIAPCSWRVQNTDNFTHKDCFARVVLKYETKNSENDTNEYLLTAFFDNPLDVMVLSFIPWYDSYLNCTKKTWKKFANNQNEQYLELETLGFKYSPTEGEWSLPIASLDQKKVAECYVEDNLADALTPISDAFDKLHQAHPYFEKIVAAAKDELGIKELE